MFVAQLVGPQGKVVSFDVDQASISTAQRRATAAGLDNAKRIGPRIALPVGPYALRAHPVQFFENIRNVSASRHGESHTPKG